MNIKDRIKELRRVPAGQLRPSPRNWRTHPETQKNALRGVLAEIGVADALLARELPDGTLELIDGHCRAEILPNQTLPVLILDVNEQEAAKLLAVLDPLAALAEADDAALRSLLAEVETDSPALQAMLADLAKPHEINSATQVDRPAPAVSATPDVWQVLVECSSEAEQRRVLQLLESEGLRYRALVG